MKSKILVVDDEPNIVLALEFLLTQEGYEVRSVNDGDAALAEVQRDPPDILLLDLKLPGRDGFEVCRAIRANRAWKRIAIVILTGRERDSDKKKALSLGVADYLTKPFATQDVLAKVKSLLGE